MSRTATAATTTTTTTTATTVLLYVPNLLGYVRIACAAGSFAVVMGAPDRWILAILLYLGNFVGDLFDGWAARALRQTSHWGGVLDMITDRCSTAGWLYLLAGEYAATDVALPFPVYRASFLTLILLDVSSHWLQMHSASLAGQHHHKSEEGNKGRNVLVRWFYQYYYFFGYLCVGTEFTYILLYARVRLLPQEQEGDRSDLLQTVISYLLMVCIPACIAKQLVNVAQLWSSVLTIAMYDARSITAQKAR